MNSKYFKNLNSYNYLFNKYDKNFLNILSVNIRSVSSIGKFNKFKYELSKFTMLPDVIAVQETWFSKQCINLYSIPGYEVVHCCRKDGYGGTSVFVKSNLNFKVQTNCSKDYMDVVSVELPDVKIMNKPIVVTSVYRSQKCILQKFFTRIENLLASNNGAPCFFVGDINIDMLSYNQDQIILKNIFSEFDMLSCHNLVTRPQSSTSIDCVFTNISHPVFIHSIENSLSDHNMISCCLELEFTTQDARLEKKCKIDYEKFENYLDNNFNERFTGDSSDLCQNFIHTFSAAAINSTTITTNRSNVRLKLTPWVSENLLSLISYKKTLLKARRKKRNDRALSERLKRISKVIKICNNKLMNEYYMNNLKSFNGDPKKTWQFLNKELGRSCNGIKTIVKEDGCILNADEDKAVAFNNFFIDIIGNMPTTLNPNDDINIFGTLIPERTVFALEKVDKIKVEYILNTLENNKSPGYDSITPKMLLVKKNLVVDILTDIFNKMIDEGSYPNVLKIHKVVPIPKVTGSNNIVNFRPVSILSIVDKIFEKIIHEQFSNYLDDNNILFERQFGFKKGVGTEEAVINVIEYICGELDAGFSGVAGVFFDYSKAFDLVNHDILIKKLQVIGVVNETLDIFRQYLANRIQFVQIGEAKSSMMPVNCGVPQGSVLGPLLFKIFINDIKNINFDGKLFMYADDICLFYRYKYTKVLQTQIEHDATILTEFSRCNKLVINPAKTKFVRFQPYRSRNYENMVVHIDGNAITESEMVNYLGIRLSHNLLWNEHITSLKSKISSGIGILYKFKNKLNSDAKMLIYKSLIHSHLTYLPIIYGCKDNSSLKSLQSAQNKALKLVFNLPLRFSTLDLFNNYAKNVLPIKGLYKQKVIMYVFKAIRENAHGPIQFTQNVLHTRRNTRQALNLSSVRCRLDSTKQRIAYAGPFEYNQLPINIRDIQILSTFKKTVKDFLLENIETLLM